MDVRIDDDALEHIASVANGDARSALNALELAMLSTPMEADGSTHITLAVAEESIQSRVVQMDESLLYDMLSAFCKSLRGSDSDAALAWFARMAYGGVDPRIVMRRVIVHASEDVGMANPMALQQAVAAHQALEAVGMPEARLAIAQAIIAVCESPKSNAVLMAVERALADAEKGGFQSVPQHLRDTPIAARKSSVPARATNTSTIIPATLSPRNTAPWRRRAFPTTYLRSRAMKTKCVPSAKSAACSTRGGLTNSFNTLFSTKE